MKKILILALATTLMMSLSACMGQRGYQGKDRVCINDSFLGISIIEVLAPCQKQ